MPECLMLDVDGVLVNGRPGDGMPWASTIREDLGIDPLWLHEMFFRPHWTEIVTGRKDVADVLDACLPLLPGGITTDRLLRYWFENDARIDESVLADCSRLREAGMRIFLATNQEHRRAGYLMEELGIGRHVDGIVYSARIGERKPEPSFYEAAAAATGFPAKSLVLVDDTPANVDGARAAGWQARLWTGATSLHAIVMG